MRAVPLTMLKGGINRLRTRGGARADTLYDLINAYIAQDGSVYQREGTSRHATLTSATAGLCAMDNVLQVFSNTLQSVPAGYVCNLLVHPTNAALTVAKIWFAKPFMGFPYVVAEFSNGNIYHYWLQSSGSWQASTVYQEGTIVTPTVLNGLAYEAQRIMAPANRGTWASQIAIAAGDEVEPTAATGYKYRAVAVAGTSPHTGDVEPSWPSVSAAIVQEFGDFSTSTDSSSTSGSTTTLLGASITDRYGNSDTIAGQTGTASSASTTAQASTTVTVWQAGTLYAPGAVVKPSTSQGGFINAIPNGDFESGTFVGSWVSTGPGVGQITTSNTYQGTYCAQFIVNSNSATIKMSSHGAVMPGQSVTVSAYLNPGAADVAMGLNIYWYDSSDTQIGLSVVSHEVGSGYRKSTGTAVAPAGAAFVRVGVGVTSSFNRVAYADLFSWNLETPAAVSNFIYEAIQSSAATSASTEPTWPVVAGNTVIDGGVTWKAIGTSIITWQAIPLLQSGTVEPTWPTTVGNTVADSSTFTSQDGHVTNTSMSWKCINRQITDTKCPNTKAVCLGASHVFAGDNDIVPFSAAVDPTDWSSSNNAGYLPTGLNNYGDNPVAALALYRSNLMVFNGGGYQMWQIDADPANNALLDAQPVGSTWPQATQSVANDLLFLTEVGVRNLGTVGATANMQIGSLGQPVDSLVVAQLTAGTYQPISLYYPGRGQYWLIFGPQALVLTVNGAGLKTWSRYIFPANITDAALNLGKLYLRTSTNLVWKFDDSVFGKDDNGGTPVAFTGVMQWPYVDVGPLGVNKMLIGVDLVGNGSVTVQVAFNENDPTTFDDNPGFATSQNVTAPYTISAADTIYGTPLPIPINSPSFSVILTFAGNQQWSWQAANMYVADASGGGVTG